MRLLSEPPHGARIVALCVAPGLGGTPERAQLALAVVHRWVEGGLGIVLADGDLGRPSLHGAVGVANSRGLGDLLLSGGDWTAAAVAADVPGLRLIPAGTSSGAAPSHLVRERLVELCRAVTSEGATLVVFTPLGSELGRWVVELSTDIVVLASEGERPMDFFAPDEDRIRALLGPPLPAPWKRDPDAAPRPRLRSPLPPEATATRSASEAPLESRRTRTKGPAAPGGQKSMEETWAAAAALVRAKREASQNQDPAPLRPPLPPRPEPVPALKDTLGPPPDTGTAVEEFIAPADDYVPALRKGARRGRRASAGPAATGKPTAVHPPAGKLPVRDEGAVGTHPDPSRPRRTGLIRAVAMLGGVALVAGGAWIWQSARALPPLEVRTTTIPRVTVPEGPREDLALGAPPAQGGAEADAAAGEPAAAVSDEPVEGTAPTPGVGEGRAPHQRFSWSVAAMGSYEAARFLAERLQTSSPEVGFAIAPITSDDLTLYRVLAGHAQERDELLATRERVAAVAGVDPATLLVRDTPLAFALLDFTDAAAAAARADELRRAGVPAYVLTLDRDDGTRVHRVYAGAYASPEEALVLMRILRGAGFSDASLVERRGRLGG